MTKYVLSICLLINFLAPLQAQWKDITPPGVQTVRDIAVLNENDAIFLSSDSLNLLYKTTDGGDTWSTVNSPAWISSDPLYWEGIQFPDAQNGFIYGTWLVNGGVFAGGTESFIVYSTTDGGNTWTPLIPALPPAGFEIISSIHFFNPLQGLATLTTGLGYDLIKTTDDGGHTWQLQDTMQYWASDLHMNDNGTGVVIRYQHDFNTHVNSYKVYQVTDFGKSWTYVGSPATDPNWLEDRKGIWYDEMLHINDTLAFRHRVDVQALGIDDDIHYYDKSTDGGHTWEDGYYQVVGQYVNRLEVKNNSVWVQSWNKLFRNTLNTSSTTAPNTGEMDLNLIPNPATAAQFIQIQMNATFNGPAEILIYANDGKLVSRQEDQIQNGLGQVTAPAAKGYYVVQINMQGQSIARKLEIY